MPKKLHFKDCKVNQEDLQELLAIFYRMAASIRHDVSNHLSLLLMAIETAIDKPELAKQMEDTARNAAQNIRGALKLYARSFELGDANDCLISKPSELVATIASSVSIKALADEGADPTLELLFPEHVIHSVLRELTINAQRHNEAGTKVFVTWRMDNQQFVCEVHDSGKGIVPDLGPAPLPLLQLKAELLARRSKGLFIVHHLVSCAHGFVLVSRSDRLGGTRFIIQLPIIKFYSERPIIRE